ncbi:ABC transporter ATP-binding protein [Novisyntrophococcus fermenticellae]|uniref:ABC transporter ATP-binding protein n=1 Tax=Novisyntrophococcus fermenticellae TaxID=2068655 RepID=UPI001E50D1DC|nr:ATP-binding cassette domain-containing protein [Novisyntrophococcus fermenticellae]
MQLEAKNISFGYAKNKKILDNLSICIPSGERTALIGPSGCGKSTLAKILAGYIKPDRGEVLFEGNPLPAKAYCPVQLIYQHPEKSINPRWKMRRTLNEAWKPEEEFVKKIGIEPEWMNRYPAELSGGEMQRFSIARALGPKTRFILADEITTMLDVITQAQIWDLMLSVVRERNLGLLVITHSEELAKQICNHIVYFEDLMK